MILISFAACQKEELSNKSIFSDEQAVKTDFDRWLDRNYVDPYNIRFEYRMPDNETGFSYWVTPPDVEKSIKVAKVVKHLSLECMVEMMADDNPDRDPAMFVKKYFPKQLKKQSRLKKF